jgi:ribosomal protein S18 acetylase RimI-like enzyme
MKIIKLLILASILISTGAAHAMQQTASIENSNTELAPQITYIPKNNEHTLERSITAQLHDKEIGAIKYMQMRPHIWHINSLYTNPQYRRLGIGSNLFIKCLTDLKKLKAHFVSWGAHAYGEKCMTDEQLKNWYVKNLEQFIESQDIGRYKVKDRINYPYIIFYFNKKNSQASCIIS